MKMLRNAATTLITAHCLLITAFAVVEQTASVLDGSGGQSTGGTLEQVSAAGQPGGISVSSNGDLVNYAGFLGTFSLQPGLDTDQDGLADELDPDNDNDALDDLTELTGSEFPPITATDPNDADSDDDGVSDGGEAISDTNPLDDTMYLHITEITGGDDVTVLWQARHGKTYQVYRIDALIPGLPGTYLHDVTANDPSAIAPWYETEARFDHLGGGTTNQGTYYIRIEE